MERASWMRTPTLPCVWPAGLLWGGLRKRSGAAGIRHAPAARRRCLRVRLLPAAGPEPLRPDAQHRGAGLAHLPPACPLCPPPMALRLLLNHKNGMDVDVIRVQPFVDKMLSRGAGEHKGELPELWLWPVVGLAPSAAALTGAPTHADPMSLGCAYWKAWLLLQGLAFFRHVTSRDRK